MKCRQIRDLLPEYAHQTSEPGDLIAVGGLGLIVNVGKSLPECEAAAAGIQVVDFLLERVQIWHRHSSRLIVSIQLLFGAGSIVDHSSRTRLASAATVKGF